MTWYPIAFLPPQYDDSDGVPYSGAVLKAYEAGTSNVISMATDFTGATLATSFALNASGYPVTSGGDIIIPHVQENYKLALYPDQASADANSGAVWTYDDIQIADTVNTAFVQSFSGDGSTTEFTLSSDLGTDEKTVMIFADMLDEYSVNGNFATDSDWTKGTGWSIGSGVATAAGAISTDLEQDAGIVLIEGESYTITMTITHSAGSITPEIGGTTGTARSSSGTYTETIIAGSTQKITFGTSGFTGTVDDVSVHRVNSAVRRILRPEEFTLENTDLTLDVAPQSGTNNIIVFAPSLLFGAVGAATAAAATSETNAANSADLAEDWATKVNGDVDGSEYSAKAYAIGGTGITDTATKGAAKEWAIETSSTVDGTDFSAKEYAKGSQAATGGSAKNWAQQTGADVTGASANSRSAKSWAQDNNTGATLGGSAKDWAQTAEDTLVDGSEYSAKHYSAKSAASAVTSESHKNAAAASAAAAASSAAEGLYNNVVTLTNADSPYTPALSEEGTLFLLDMTGGVITINLSALSTYGEDMKFAFAKIDAGGNSATINRGGADIIDGGASLSVGTQYVVNVLVGDSATGNWLSAIQSQSVPDGSITFAKMQNISTDSLIGRDIAGSGAPEAISVTGGIEFTGSQSLRVSAFTGDVTKAAGGTSLSITNNAVTLAHMQHGTQGDILYYGTSGAPTRLAPGTAGQVLQSGGAEANPTWEDSSGGLIGYGYAEKTAAQTISSAATIPIDDTIPQNTEGAEVLALAYTPNSATSKLLINVKIWLMTASNNPDLTAALFVDSTADALAAASHHPQNTIRGTCVDFLVEVDSASTSARTYKLRAGPAASLSNVYVNSNDGSNNAYGGVVRTIISILEIEV